MTDDVETLWNTYAKRRIAAFERARIPNPARLFYPRPSDIVCLATMDQTAAPTEDLNPEILEDSK